MDTIVSWTPESFKKAVVEGKSELVRSMIFSKADVNQTYEAGLTPMHFAAIHNRIEVARVLKYSGASCLAETSDEARVTPGMIAHMQGHNEVFEIICEELPDPPEDAKNSILRRALGPSILVILVVLDTIFGIMLVDPETRWDGFREGPETLGQVEWYRTLVFTLEGISVTLLVVVAFLDPGVINREDVSFVQQLRELPPDQLMCVGDDTFAVLKDGKADPVHTYRWCRTCALWRPPNVSHCGTCGRCMWRYDHHCIFVGNCVALRNHRFFSVALLTGSAAWLMGDAAVLQRLIVHGGVESLGAWWPPRPGLENLYGSLLYVLFGLLLNILLLPFAVFHTGSLLGNCTTKSMWRPTRNAEKSRLNTPAELQDLFCAPLRLRECGRQGDGPGLSTELSIADQLSEMS